MTFIIHTKSGSRITYSNRFDENDEHQVDAAWEDVRMQYPDADYIESF